MFELAPFQLQAGDAMFEAREASDFSSMRGHNFIFPQFLT